MNGRQDRDASTDKDTAAAAQGPSKSGFDELRRAVVSAALALVTYYGMRAAGATPVDALIAATAVSAARVALSALWHRTLDLVACFLATLNGTTLAVGLITQSPIVTQLSQHVPGVLFALFVLGSWAMNRPVTEFITSWLRPGWVDRHISEHSWTNADVRHYHRLHMRLSLVVGLLGIAHVALVVVIIFSCSADVSLGLREILAIVVNSVMVVLILGAIAQFLKRHRVKRS